MAHSYDWWLTPSVVAGVHLFQLEARIERARWNGRALLFRFPVLFRLAIILVVPFLTYLLVREWAGEDWFIRILGSMITVAFLLAWPPVILVTPDGIERRFWGRPRVLIPWKEIVDAEINDGKDITVIGLNASIQFSRFHSDQDRFRKELWAHTKIRRFSSPERVIGLHL
jgi:hypothetical protein